jgi:hypothetical protein
LQIIGLRIHPWSIHEVILVGSFVEKDTSAVVKLLEILPNWVCHSIGEIILVEEAIAESYLSPSTIAYWI